MITKEYFTTSADALVDKFFGGVRYKQSKNGVYFVVHTDTVHKHLPSPDDIVNRNGILSAPTVGLGADDRAGCYIVRALMDKYPDCGYLLSPDEETGDSIFRKEVPTLVAPKVFISFDRKGLNNYVDYGYGCYELEDFLYDNCGIERDIGTYSTCSILAKGYGVPCVNLCFGGDNFHREDEYLDVYYLERMAPVYCGLVEYCVDYKGRFEVVQETVTDIWGYGGGREYGGYGTATPSLTEFDDIDDYGYSDDYEDYLDGLGVDSFVEPEPKAKRPAMYYWW